MRKNEDRKKEIDPSSLILIIFFLVAIVEEREQSYE